MLTYLFEDKKFYRILVHLAIPIAVQNLISSAVNMLDTIMIGQMGETEIAAVGQANQLFFLFNLMLFGINSGSAIFTAQFWGKRDVTNIRRVLGIGLISAVSAGALFTILALFFPGQVMSIYSKDPAVVEAGIDYLQIVGFSYIITAVSFVYSAVLRSTEQPKLPMVCSVASLLTNAVLNYVLIFGKFGFPQMGVAGAALATVIARVIEVALMLVLVYAGKYVAAARVKEMFDLTRDFVKRFFRTSFPVMLNETLWAIGVSIYSVIYGQIGTQAVAAVNISGTVQNIAMILFMGMSNASATMIGNRIGAGDEDQAYIYAKRLLTLGVLFAIVMGGLTIMTSGFFLNFFHVTHAVRLDSQKIIAVFALLMPARIFNNINIVGVLRSGGDTKYAAFLDTSGVWLISIPLALVGALLLNLPIYWVYFLVRFEEVFKFALGLRRYRSKKWINNLVRHISSDGQLDNKDLSTQPAI